MTHPNDVILWPCGEWGYREDLHEFGHKSDDYEVLPAESEQALALSSDTPNSHGNQIVPTAFRRYATTSR